MTLDLIDITGGKDQPTGDSATLDGARVTYQGNGVKNILVTRLKEESPEDVFKNMNGWSNAYVMLRERRK